MKQRERLEKKKKLKKIMEIVKNVMAKEEEKKIINHINSTHYVFQNDKFLKTKENL